MKLFLPQIVESWLSRPMVSKMISFGVIGLGNTVIDLAIFTFAYQVLSLPLVPANVLAWLVAVSGSYVMNTMITFHAESGRVLRRKDYLSFVASGVLGVIATTTTLVVLSHFMPVIAAKLVSIVAGFVVNFTMSHFVVFRSKPPGEIIH
ncbi:putative flippase GtrA [Nitrobacteraceae bacterium AZCC 2161]|jgi:putative flippase GtrA